MSDDILEFLESNKTVIHKRPEMDLLDLMPSIPSEPKKSTIRQGQPVQYTMAGEGFVATSHTVARLPAGMYDIQFSSNVGFLAIPCIEQSGLLLELPEMRSDAVIQIVETFWASEKDYKEGNEFVNGGAAYKCGIMLYGPPGSGKSCTLKIVCNKLVEKDGIVFYANNNPVDVLRFVNQFAKIEENRKSIIILEDIDSLIQMWGENIYLEMLDSAKSVNNVLFIATTNYPDRIDPRIYNRPGRFSHVIKIGLPTIKAREAYLKAVLKNHRDIDTIVQNTEKFTIDHISALINAVYREKKELLPEIERLKKLFQIPKIKDDVIGLGISE